MAAASMGRQMLQRPPSPEPLPWRPQPLGRRAREEPAAAPSEMSVHRTSGTQGADPLRLSRAREGCMRRERPQIMLGRFLQGDRGGSLMAVQTADRGPKSVKGLTVSPRSRGSKEGR